LNVHRLFKIARFSNFVGTGRLRVIAAAPAHISPYGYRGRQAALSDRVKIGIRNQLDPGNRDQINFGTLIGISSES